MMGPLKDTICNLDAFFKYMQVTLSSAIKNIPSKSYNVQVNKYKGTRLEVAGTVSTFKRLKIDECNFCRRNIWRGVPRI